MSSGVVQLILLALASAVTADRITRIRNGNLADPAEFPFLASIRIKGVHICGGSIINSQFILTAGHCVSRAMRENLADVTVMTGSVHLATGGVTSQVTAMNNTAGDGHDPDTDIGLLKLAVPLEYNSFTRSIKFSSDVPNDDFGTVIGWGSTRKNDTAATDRLHYYYAYITDMNCNSFYKQKHIICTNNGPTVGVCYGDSGSPLIYKGKIVGVVSRAVLCAKGFPDVYSSIAHNYNYILITINSL